MQHTAAFFIQISEAFTAQRERWPLWLPVLLGGGIGIYFALPFEPALGLGWAACAILAVGAWGLRDKVTPSQVLVALSVMMFGLALAGLRTWWIAAPVIQAETGPVTVSGQVERYEVLDKGYRVTVTNLQISRLGPDLVPSKVRIKLNGQQPAIIPGQWIEVRADLRPPPPPAMPGAFDFQRQSYFRGLGGVGFAYGKAQVIGDAPIQGYESLGFAFERMRKSIAERVRSLAPGQSGAMAAALMTGERGAIPSNVLEDMRNSGLAHLLAISGLHVGLIAGIVFFTFRAVLALAGPVALRYPIKKWAAVAAIISAFLYAMLAGATVPTQRAFFMIFLVLMAVLFDRKAISMRLVAWAATVILVISPESLLGASFQMSFAAVVALVAVYESLQRRGVLVGRAETFSGQILRYVGGVALTTVVAGFATGVFAAYHFNRVADFGLVANLIAVPVMALWIMPWAVVSYALMPMGLEAYALAPMVWGVDIVIATAQTVGNWNGAVTLVPAFPVWGLIAITLGGLWLAIWRDRLRLMGIPIALVGTFSFFIYNPPDILVHGNGKLIAVRTADGGYAFSTLTSSKFERDIWARRAGLRSSQSHWRQVGQDLRCDALGCIYLKNDKMVAIAQTPEALMEDCWRSDVMISIVPSQTACVPRHLFVGPKQLVDHGTHAMWLNDSRERIRIETVASHRGSRPWVVKSTR